MDEPKDSQGISHIDHVWVGAPPFFNTTLFAQPICDKEGYRSSTLSFYDADGELFNQAQLQVAAGKVGVLELDQFTADCKLDFGMRHCQLRITSDGPAKFYCRIHNSHSAGFMTKAISIAKGRAEFMPMSFGLNKSNLLAVLNVGDSEAHFRGKLFLGSRAPEIVQSVPARGTRLISLESEFSAYRSKAGSAAQAYLRVCARPSDMLAAQLLESFRFVEPQTEEVKFELFNSVG